MVLPAPQRPNLLADFRNALVRCGQGNEGRAPPGSGPPSRPSLNSGNAPVASMSSPCINVAARHSEVAPMVCNSRNRPSSSATRSVCAHETGAGTCHGKDTSTAAAGRCTGVPPPPRTSACFSDDASIIMSLVAARRLLRLWTLALWARAGAWRDLHPPVLGSPARVRGMTQLLSARTGRSSRLSPRSTGSAW